MNPALTLPLIVPVSTFPVNCSVSFMGLVIF